MTGQTYETIDNNSWFRRPTSTSLNHTGGFVHGDGRQDPYDLVALTTVIADAYSNSDMLEMTVRVGAGENLDSGKVSQVSTVSAQFNRPSNLDYSRSERNKKIVVIKRSEKPLFNTVSEETDPAMRSFITELRILGFERLRSHPNIVTLLGLHWDCLDPAYPEPLILLEKAEHDLQKFLKTYESLTFATKTLFAQEIARGLSALHSYGIVHGDLKPQNVLVFESPLTVKLADFSHSFFDTGESREVVGGTTEYAAPEWKTTATTSQLMKTDLYSYGIVFAELMAGRSVFEPLRGDEMHNEAAFVHDISSLKASGEAAEYILSFLHEEDAEVLTLTLEDFPLIEGVIGATIRVNPLDRDLSLVLRHLGDKPDVVHSDPKPSILSLIDRVDIPYQAFHPVSDVIKQHILRALEKVARDDHDPRKTAACFELSVCYLGDFGVSVLDTSNTDRGFKWLLEAARQGSMWARSISLRISQTLDFPIPENDAVGDWLFESASSGSRIALESLKLEDTLSYIRAKDAYLTQWLGLEDALSRQVNSKAKDTTGFDPFLVVALDDWERFEAGRHANDLFDINSRNKLGDTLLIHAAKAGRFNMVKHLIESDADGRICNSANENALHFLGSFDEQDMVAAGELLCDAGANMLTKATGYTGESTYERMPVGNGIPALRAIALDQPRVLEFFLRRRRPTGSSLRLMFSTAVLLYNVKILEVLKDHYGDVREFKELYKSKWWRNGKLRNIGEICILGPVSANPLCGFDLPDKFWRFINYGVRHTQCLDETLDFLNQLGFDFCHKRCGQERNALFFAVKEGRRDAARWLMEYDPEFQDYRPHDYKRFGKATAKARGSAPPLVSKDSKHVAERVTRSMSLAYQQEDPMYRALDVVLNYVGDPTGWSRTHQRSTELESDVDESSDSDEAQSETYELYVDDMGEVTIEPCSSGEETEPESDSEDETSPIRPFGKRQAHGIFRDGFTATDDGYITRGILRDGRRKKPRTEQWDRTVVDLRNSSTIRKSPLVDVVIHAIRCGYRGIFQDLLTLWGGHALCKGQGFDLFICTEHRTPIRRGYNDISYMFSGSADKYHVTFRENTPKDCRGFETDGTLNYALLYMTTIARSVHRDIIFADILFTVLDELDIPEPLEWTSRNAFEDACLSSESEFGQATPLYHAAVFQWRELSERLMLRGSGPQSTCFYTHGRAIGSKSSVLSRLIATTANERYEVTQFLEAARRFDFDSLVKVEDIQIIFILNQHPTDAMEWDDNGLCWSQFEHEEDIGSIWDVIAQVDDHQKIPLRKQDSYSRLIVQAARSRDLNGVDALLRIGFEPNGYLSLLKLFQFQTTALDMVAWTEDVSDSEFKEGDLSHKQRNADIARILRQHGGQRGWEYTWEFQIFSLVAHGIIPAILMEGFGFLLLSGTIAGFWFGSKLSINSCPDKDPLWWIGFGFEKLGTGHQVFWFFACHFRNMFMNASITWKYFRVLQFLFAFQILMIIALAVACAEGVWFSLGGLIISDFMVALFWTCLWGGFILNNIFFVEVVTWRVSFLARHFHGDCGWRRVLRLLRWASLGPIRGRYCGEILARFIRHVRQTWSRPSDDQIVLQDREPSYRSQWSSWRILGPFRDRQIQLDDTVDEPYPTDPEEGSSPQEHTDYASHRRRGRRWGLKTTEFIKSRIWPAVMFPITMAAEAIIDVANWSRRRELQRMQGRIALS